MSDSRFDLGLELLGRSRSFEGWVETYRHPSTACRAPMRFSVYRPPQSEKGPVPVLYWLSGLTCTEENFMTKAGAQQAAARHGILLVTPDTSPRGAGVEGEEKDWDLGTGAGLHVNATEPKWSTHYRMDDYVSRELPALIRDHFPARSGAESISGHSMGGHGAIVLALRQPGRYRSVSAFSPICAPSRCPWGQKAFTHYLGADRDRWAEYDACRLVESGGSRQPLLVDQGADDKFLTGQLMPDALREACLAKGHPLELRMHHGYDHSYYFISTFIADHIEYHARHLNA